MRHALIERERFQFAESVHDQRAAGSFVAPARLHADKAVLHQVDAADAVLAADLVELLEQRDGGGVALAVHRNRRALLEPDGHVFRLIRRVLGRSGQHPDFVRGRIRRIFQRAALVRNVPDVAVAAVDLLGGLRDRHVMLGRVLDSVLARNDVPLAPRSDHRQMRSQRLIGQLKSHLIVALAGAAVRQRVAAGFQCDFHLAFGQQGPGDGGPQQILMFVLAAGADHLPQILGDKLFAHVRDVAFLGAGRLGFLLETGQLVAALADVTAHGDDFAAVVFLQPRNDDGGIESARIRERYFLGFVHRNR